MAKQALDAALMTRSRRQLRRVIAAALAVTAAVFAAMVIYGARAAEGSALAAAVGMVLVAAGAVAVGGILGFLFGIPARVAEAAGAAEVPSGSDEESAPRPRACGANQLVQVAEWLTRILIGATVTQLAAVRDLLESTSEVAGANILGHAGGTSVVAGAIVYALVFGFFLGHLCTRLILNVLFQDAERSGGLGRLGYEMVSGGPGAGKAVDTISRTLAEEVVARDVRELTDPEDVRAWGLARLKTADNDQAAVSAAVSAFTRSFVARPNQRSAVESLVLGLLYQDRGYERAIEEAQRYLAVEADASAGANLHAYLACALGQRYARTPPSQVAARAADASAAVDAVAEAIRRDPSWKARLRRFASAGPEAIDDDLVVLAGDAAPLRALLDLPPPSPASA